jgi:hypothetical protein
LSSQRIIVGGHPDLPAGAHQEGTMAITERDPDSLVGAKVMLCHALTVRRPGKTG